ncbi:SGNH/GDSL hydrolase family protein [Zafaria sp. Z1313]|uniref:SGNH/GDSL hydrolase family protein n=1 Tax=unclassified Zafaria TaxID=2828765 RepID=UPI002E79F290|nr:GDSL-type esterase/lipase family protein [Zafaria sp. J156]MEE1622302.1 GDSL-type esterase/lipase family protein [Zafaria sp. J156]
MPPVPAPAAPPAPRPNRALRRGRAAAVVLSVLLAAALLAVLQSPAVRGPASGAPVPAVAGTGSEAVAGADVLRFAVAGDSITADHAFPEDVRRREVGERSWVRHAQAPGVEFTGGWAVGGATSADMAAGLGAVDADVLVVLAGTNDIYRGTAPERIGANLIRLVEAAGAPRVVVSSIPPRDGFGGPTLEYNAWLEAFAAEQGWEWVDAAAGLRAADDPGRFAPGMAYDGIHPDHAGARVIGAAVLAHLAEVPTAAGG